MSPLLGYTRNTYDGPGTTTYHFGENEFLLNEQVQSVDQLYRVGVGFNYAGIRAGFTQGWRMYDWKSVATLAPGAGSGNVTTPILGQPVTADAIVGTQSNKINTPVTNAWITGTLFGRVKLIGTYIKADASNETNYVEADAGKFLSFEIARFFSGLGETVDSRARTDYWRASARADINITSNVDLTGGWAENSRVLDGQALISQLFLDTVTYAGQSTGDLLREVNARTAVDDMSRVYDAGISARVLGPFSVNAGWSQTQQDRDRDARRLRDRRSGRTGRPLRAPRQHLRGRRLVRGVRRDADRRLPPRRRRPADLPDRLHPSRPVRLPRQPGTTRTS